MVVTISQSKILNITGATTSFMSIGNIEYNSSQDVSLLLEISDSSIVLITGSVISIKNISLAST